MSLIRRICDRDDLARRRTETGHRVPSRVLVPGVIRSFRCKDTERLYRDTEVRRFASIERAARRKLLLVDKAKSMLDLRNPPGNRLEALTGDRRGQYSIHINDQWRVCFRWSGRDAFEVEIVDYHR